MECERCEAKFKAGMEKIREGIRIIREEVGGGETASQKELADLDEAATNLQLLYRRLNS